MFVTKHTVMKSLYSALVSLVVLSGCAADNMVDVVPQPMKVRVKSGTFNPVGAPVRYSPEFRGDAESAVIKFADRLSETSGTQSEVSVLAESVPHEGFAFVYDNALGAEEYRLRIDRRSAVVRASSLSGVLYSLATLSQMLPAAYFGSVADADAFWQLPCCEIQDRPRFAWRGMHLDVARHFFGVEEVKKYLDIMALYKMNRFHWHLSDDQGWRVEIKKYPRLTSVGSVRVETMLGRIDYDEQPLTYDGTPYGGFYTQEEIREVVAYAASLGITVVPEIDLPGHMLSALAAYPELGCRGGAYKVWGRWGISKDVLCVGKETTFDFIEGVMDEIMEMFPGTYIHIGGDECPKIAWKTCQLCQERIRSLGITWDGVHTPEQLLQNYVTARVQKYLAEHGRRIIGWDEILEGNLSPGATVMSWRGVSGGIEAAAKGFDVVMTPCDYLYLDYYQSEHADKEPLGIGGRLPIEKVYSFEPYDGLPADARQHILGVQANLWTEYIATTEHLEYNLLPRMLAVSEVQWCAPGRRDFDRFRELVLARQFPMLDAMERNYSRAIEGIYGMSRGNAAD